MSGELKIGFWWTRSGRLACVVERNSTSIDPLKGCVAGFGGFCWDDDGCSPGMSKDDLVEYIGLTHPVVTERPTPEPKWVPWTADDNICGTIVKSKTKAMTYVICTQGPFFVQVGGTNTSYRELFSDCIQLDGTPCGKQVIE